MPCWARTTRPGPCTWTITGAGSCTTIRTPTGTWSGTGSSSQRPQPSHSPSKSPWLFQRHPQAPTGRATSLLIASIRGRAFIPSEGQSLPPWFQYCSNIPPLPTATLSVPTLPPSTRGTAAFPLTPKALQLVQRENGVCLYPRATAIARFPRGTVGLGASKLAGGEPGVTFLQPQRPFPDGSAGSLMGLQLCSPGPLAFPRGCVAVAAHVGSFGLGDVTASGGHLCGRLEKKVPRGL